MRCEGGLRTYVDEVSVVTLFEVVQHGGVVEVGEGRHVVALLELWRVNLLKQLLLQDAL